MDLNNVAEMIPSHSDEALEKVIQTIERSRNKDEIEAYLNTLCYIVGKRMLDDVIKSRG